MTGSIIVLYNFSTERVYANLQQHCKQMDIVCLVDNSSTDNSDLFSIERLEKGGITECEKVHYIPLLSNHGIAYAQNIGIDFVTQKGCKHILFSDDDSLLSEDFVHQLKESLIKLQDSGIKVGAVGPRAYNRQTGAPYPYTCNKIRTRTTSDIFTEVTDLMSSGTLTTTEVISEIGKMDESLFIDGIDSEWCWRGKQKGYRFFVCENIHLQHTLGLGTKDVCGKSISITPPNRMYYMYRNYLRFLKRDYVPMRWKVYNGIKYVLKAVYYPLFGAERREYIKNIIKGIKDA